ncbi:DUF6461 domain-containing protein [Streptomyces antarcticus]|uniref:DUF6461 domain-containing protein n=1 Tax=Streptomyces antarcticus TaxID=2996458 RepID=UPI00226E7F6E|nr:MULTISPECIES: DUF6461 domain-containing protein [unclassified Streptomyces]MCY0945877.1 DUF6461 domain-containing protein [Streptomyces sp. H34-AA3]MCZ4085747.1 DUF6461 domain-containing protein [Streptomyces sp. H34-S5]
MTKTGADYAWFENDFPDIAEAYCFTLVRGLSPAELMSRIGGQPESPLQGIAAVTNAAFAQYGLADGARQLVAMTTVGAWTLLIEPNGYLGVTEDRALPASAGASWISHFVNVNAVGTFLWAEDQVLRLCFDPMFAEDRWGTSPDELLDVMRRIGFHLEEENPETDLSSPAAFALAEHLTGIAITPALLLGTTFTCATIQIG